MRIVLVVNPTKVADIGALRDQVTRRATGRGWAAPQVLETTKDDPGEGMARRAVAEGAELVLSGGGDGTVMSVARGLAHTDVPLGVLPVGTGNLLARNLGLPLDVDAAVEVALGGRSRRIDLGRACAGADGPPLGFAVMAGIGFDAAMMADAPEGLKKVLGWPAYVVSGIRHLRDKPMSVQLTIDGRPAVTRRARAIVVGNVGMLQGGLQLLPDALPDDGLLDVVVLTPRRLGDWLRVAVRIARRRRKGDKDVERFQARSVELRTAAEQPSQLDGDPAGEVGRLLLEIDPGALLLRVAR
ncbi:MAG: hypothetical protein JWL64_1012 [Frankiales bacterium]|nr:hypothetical protein [Frankiales bacterium]